MTPNDATTGRRIVQARPDPPLKSDPDTCPTTDAIINPTTSSIIAADNRTVPIRVLRKSTSDPNEERIAIVVPSDVEHIAAPAVKPCNGDISYMNTKPIRDRPMGTRSPTKATNVESKILALSRLKFVDNPPEYIVNSCSF